MDRTDVTSMFVGRIGVGASISEKTETQSKLTSQFDMRIIFRDETTPK